MKINDEKIFQFLLAEQTIESNGKKIEKNSNWDAATNQIVSMCKKKDGEMFKRARKIMITKFDLAFEWIV